jgi:hypothetical protein
MLGRCLRAVCHPVSGSVSHTVSFTVSRPGTPKRFLWEGLMAEKQKPTPAIVKKAAHFMKHPEDATKRDIKSMAARLLDDQRNDPQQHKPKRK